MNILMVCLGNICRSPLAEGIMRKKLMESGIEGTVDSAGTASYHIGESPDPRSEEMARKYGIDISQERARAFTRSDFEQFDIIFAMDRENYTNILRLARTDEDRQKVELILNRLHPGKDLEVPDPYYGGKDGFEHVYQMLDASCERIAQSLKN
jgi:protein-tyrosine phosphatase